MTVIALGMSSNGCDRRVDVRVAGNSSKKYASDRATTTSSATVLLGPTVSNKNAKRIYVKRRRLIDLKKTIGLPVKNFDNSAAREKVTDIEQAYPYLV
jgi:hypothetical protein